MTPGSNSESIESLSSHFQSYSSCDVADSVTALCNGCCLTIPNLTQVSGDETKPIVGPVYTVEYASLDDPRPSVKPHYIDQAPKDSIILIGTSTNNQLSYAPYTNLNCALYGGLMSTRASYLGCKGTVVLGNVRDINEHRKLNYPVFSFGRGVAAASANAKVVAVNKTLVIDNLGEINSGDWVIVDENGLSVIPQERLKDVSIDIEKRSHADELASIDIKNGRPASDSIKIRRSEIE